MGIPGVALKKPDILNAIRLKKGIIKHAAELLNCERETIYQWMNKDEDIANAVTTARDQAIKDRSDDDNEIVQAAYLSLLEQIKKGEATPTLFALKCKAGWAEKSLVDTSINVKFEKPFEQNSNNSPPV